jgi:hypothetical protein
MRGSASSKSNGARRLIKSRTGSPVCLRPGAGARIAGAVAALLLLPCTFAHAQFIRIGPFDFGATAKLGGVYTTNVEGVRPDSTTQEMEDYYATAGFDITSSTAMFRNSTLDLSTGMTVERHARRPDLDTTSDPFGRARIDTAFELGRYTLRLNYATETTVAEQSGTDVPSGANSTRDVNTVVDYGAELEWQRNDLTVAGGVNGSTERHQDQQFKVADNNTYEGHLNADWQFSQRLGLSYAYKRDRTELLNVPDSFSDWNERHTVGLTLEILERPNILYTLGAEQSSVQGETINWEPTHTLTLKDGLEMSRTLHLTGNAQYKYAKRLAADEVAFTCNLSLDNEISRTVSQSLSVNKEPANTFGSTAATDVTAVKYTLTKQDLFIYDLTFNFIVGYSYNKPMNSPQGEAESIWTYDVSLIHERALSRKLNRKLGYTYHHERSNLISEDLSEHSVTLDFTYTF